jgi:hypothetical protein
VGDFIFEDLGCQDFGKEDDSREYSLNMIRFKPVGAGPIFRQAQCDGCHGTPSSGYIFTLYRKAANGEITRGDGDRFEQVLEVTLCMDCMDGSKGKIGARRFFPC